MILALLSMVALVASFEAFRESSLAARLMDVAFVVVCTIIGLWSLRRYLFLMMRAEEVANQAQLLGLRRIRALSRRRCRPQPP